MRLALSALTLLIAATAIAGDRDFSTPSTRLLGHWESRSGTEYFFGRIDAATEFGSLTWVETSADGRVVKHKYKIVSETPDDEELSIQVHYASGDRAVWTFRVYRDGYAMTGQRRSGSFTFDDDYIYIDDRVGP